jgi:predicted permease
VVLSHSGWKSVFGGDPDIVGKQIVLDGQNYTVIGITPEDFKGTLPIIPPVLWAPLMQLGHVDPGFEGFESRGNNSLNLIARFKPGVSIDLANQRMKSLVAELKREYPKDYEDSGINLVLQSDAGIHPMFKSAQVGLSSVIMGVVAMLLLIACVNVANLFLARARDRSREMAVRLSIGAGRGVLVRQLLTESLVMAGLAGLVGLAVAWWAIGLANRLPIPADFDFTPDLTISPAVLVFTLLVSLMTGVLFGLAPALQATRPALIPALKGEAPAGGGRSRMSRGLVVVQMALSIILLICAGLFLRSLKAATEVDKGFISDNLLVAQVDPGLQGYSRPRSEDFYRRLTERLRALPNVTAVGLGDQLPLGFGNNDWGVSIPGYTPAPNEGMSINVSIVAPGFFEAMGIPLLQGRGFTAQDDSAAARAIVVNQRFAQRFWPGQNPIGRIVKIGGNSDHTVIGVVPTGKYRSLGEEPTAFMYLAQTQHWSSGMTVFIRTRDDPVSVAPILRQEVASYDPNLPVVNLRTMNNALGLALLPARLAGTVLGVFGVLGLVLASIGIYGVMSYSVAQRKREIGIRLAIGAASATVVRLVLREGMVLALIGMVIGLAGAMAGVHLLRGLLYGNSFDPLTFLAVPVVLGAVAALAVWIPARRASSVDPVVVLRQE